MTIQSAMTLANINTRAQRITADYNCTILSDSVLLPARASRTAPTKSKTEPAPALLMRRTELANTFWDCPP